MGDNVLLLQNKITTKQPYDPDPNTVTKVRNTIDGRKEREAEDEEHLKIEDSPAKTRPFSIQEEEEVRRHKKVHP